MSNVPMTRFRWTIVALLFFATSINYIDRQVIGLLEPTLAAEFHWDNTTYGFINGIFQFFYAFGLLAFGWIVDKVGTKRGYSISITIWSVFAMGHALAKSTLGFTVARSGLGLGESGNFPTAIKSVAEWFPKKERALATGIFNSGANIGAVIAPIMVPWILGIYGWQMAFMITGALGFIWLVCWLLIYEIPSRKKGLGKSEFDYIHSDVEDAASVNDRPASWKRLLGVRQTWAFIFGKFLTDPIWWFFLFWLPGYFKDTFNLSLTKPGWPLVIVYSATTVGSIGGGYLSGMLIRKGWPVYKARKTVMLIFAFCVVPIITARYFTDMWMVVALISLAAAAHQAWSANIFTTCSDMFPKRAVSSVTGIGGMAGSVGGIIFQPLVGWILDYFQRAGNKGLGYNLIFLICGFAYLLAWLVMHFFAPKMTPVRME
ncbi:MAG: MFS transporter [Bacteroidota bacterium]|nr:MFS transporter [Bacteroidota bacterium]MDP4214560.1 MFS transporter [Bacteroidota bacterium]MDP4245639.1 MFS transporter [Bacteroidota bacterium]MDP4254854.1 MFS transporter [Bacteroidota bacterium]MDP4257863.1 MFS transporter [Bacteroidota bacterium]